MLFSLVVAFQNYEGDFLVDQDVYDTQWFKDFFPKLTKHLKECLGLLEDHKDFSMLSPSYPDWKSSEQQPARSRSVNDYDRALTCLKIMIGEIQEEHINDYLKEYFYQEVQITSVFSPSEIRAMRAMKFDAPTKEVDIGRS